MAPGTLIFEPGLWGYVFLFLAGFVATEPWRYMGVWFARSIAAESESMRWVRAVSTAIIAGLVTRMVVFPTGALSDVPLEARLFGFCLAIAVFFASRRVLAVGIMAGSAVIMAGHLIWAG